MITIIGLYGLLPIIICILFELLGSNKVKPIAALIPIFILISVIVYFFLPSRNVLSLIGGNWFYGALYLGLYRIISVGDSDNYGIDSKLTILGTAVIILLALVGLGGALHSHMSVKPTWESISKSYSKSTEAPTFKRGETPIALAPKTVLNRVRKAASDIPNSQYYSISDNVQAQYYKGKPVYVVPIEYNGFFQMRNAEEIPGYFIIDATSQNASPKFVKKPYIYATSAYFGKDAARQFYKHLPDWLSLGKPQLEIDDKGTPYWVQTIYKSEFLSHRVNYQKLHVAVMNAQTGAVRTYSINDMPSFIDEGITSATASKINSDFGRYKYGFWNSILGKSGVIKPTGNGVEDGVTSIFNRDGSISYFTDFTTDKTGSDSAMGYSMINARTGKLTFYKASNLMDSDGAIHNADQDYKAQQWKAKMPVLYNVNGQPTWVMTIVDSTHAIRGYYYLNASDQSIYASGSTPTSALDAYRQALVNNGGYNGNTEKAETKDISGTVDRVAIVSNKNKVMFTLKENNTIYTVNTNDFDAANLLRQGDQVSFKASVVNGKAVGNVSSFKNKSLN